MSGTTKAIRKGEWNLSDLVSSREDFDAKSKALEDLTVKVEGSRSFLKNDISEQRFNSVVRDLEDLNSLSSILEVYAYLRKAEDTQSEEAKTISTKVDKLVYDASARSKFFDIWWQQELDDAGVDRLMAQSGDLSYYLKRSREIAQYTLSEPEEKTIAILTPSGPSAIVKLYTTITNKFVYEIEVDDEAKKLTRDPLMELARRKEPEIRERAYKTLLSKYEPNLGVLGEIYQARVSGWRAENVQLRKHSSPIHARNVKNDLEDSSVEVLLDACDDHAQIFGNFFELKAKEAGLQKLRRYDIYLPIGQGSTKTYSYEDAQKMVIDAWGAFSPVFADNLKKFYAGNHIDYGIREGKRSGAFMYAATPSILPYIQVTFNGTLGDIVTFGHESGHGLHYVLASGHSVLNAGATLPIMETGSTFSESMVLDSVIEKLDRDEARYLLFKRIDGFYAGILRQAYIVRFEIAAHDKIAEGAENNDLNKIWFDTLKAQFKDSVDVPQEFEIEWATTPHIYDWPFYCYAYPYGNLLALALFQRYKNEGGSFARDYQAILAAGGSQNPQKLFEQHGIDLSSRKLWDDGFDYIDAQVQMLRRL